MSPITREDTAFTAILPGPWQCGKCFSKRLRSLFLCPIERQGNSDHRHRTSKCNNRNSHSNSDARPQTTQHHSSCLLADETRKCGASWKWPGGRNRVGHPPCLSQSTLLTFTDFIFKTIHSFLQGRKSISFLMLETLNRPHPSKTLLSNKCFLFSLNMKKSGSKKICKQFSSVWWFE